MRIYPNEITIRFSVVTLLEMYNKGIFRSGQRAETYDQKFINLLLLELIGLDSMDKAEQIDDITMKFIFGKKFFYTRFTQFSIKYFFFYRAIQISSWPRPKSLETFSEVRTEIFKTTKSINKSTFLLCFFYFNKIYYPYLSLTYSNAIISKFAVYLFIIQQF